MGFLWITTLIVVGLYLFRKILRKYWGTADRGNEEDVTNKIVVVTGANAGIGLYTAIEMAERGAVVVMACRDIEKAQAAVIRIRKKTGNGKLIPMKLDLASLQSVRDFATDVSKKFDKIDILINNAGVLTFDKANMKTKDGFELHFGVNHLGHFLLTNLLLEQIKRAAPSRIVTVSSLAHNNGHIDFGDLMGENIKTSSIFDNKYYANSKLANALFSQELAKRLWGSNVNSYCLCPGIVKTEIFKTAWYWTLLLKIFGSIFVKTPRQGCQTTMHCALNKQLAYETGEMYTHCRKWLPEDRITLRREVAARLWSVSEELTGLIDKSK